MQRAYPLHEDAVECRECGRPYNALEKHVHAAHGYGLDEYRRRYPGAPTCSETHRTMLREHALDRRYDTAELPIYWTREAVIEALQLDAEKRGRPPLAQEWRRANANGWRPVETFVPASRKTGTPSEVKKSWEPKRPCPSYHVVERLFGSWNGGLIAAGLAPRQPGMPRGYTRWPAERALSALRRDAKRRGRPPSKHEWNTATTQRPSHNIVEKLFGSWGAGLIAAGLEPSKGGRPRKRQ
jgi:hypothetical protein